MAFGHWFGARGGQNKEETEGILTKGFTTNGSPRGDGASSSWFTAVGIHA
jgi:hypothetical protein